MSRFGWFWVIGCFGCLWAAAGAGGTLSDGDRQAIESVFRKASVGHWQEKPMGEVLVLVGRSFRGCAYRAHTLEAEGPERLIVDLKHFDCATFVDTCLALARCIAQDQMEAARFCDALTTIRYQSGHIDGYASRLHYFTHWILDAERKGLVLDVTHQLGGIPFRRRIDFMSRHADLYPKLQAEDTKRRIVAIEEMLSDQPRTYISTDQVSAASRGIQHGDLIALTCTTDGLDIAHVGFAVRVQGTVRFLHASLDAEAIVETAQSLAVYVANHPRADGIMVLRALPPTAASRDDQP